MMFLSAKSFISGVYCMGLEKHSCFVRSHVTDMAIVSCGSKIPPNDTGNQLPICFSCFGIGEWNYVFLRTWYGCTHGGCQKHTPWQTRHVAPSLCLNSKYLLSLAKANSKCLGPCAGWLGLL